MLPSLEEFLLKEAPNTILSLKPFKKNLDLKAMILSKDNPKVIKNQAILTTCLIVDGTAKVNCNFYGEAGKSLKAGDIVYIMSGYTGFYQSRLVLYTS